LSDRGRAADQDALDARLAERRDESTERAAWRLGWHRSSGDFEKNRALEQFSLVKALRAQEPLEFNLNMALLFARRQGQAGEGLLVESPLRCG
jgi:hypothetical protein